MIELGAIIIIFNKNRQDVNLLIYGKVPDTSVITN